jgi:hypothetical protein
VKHEFLIKASLFMELYPQQIFRNVETAHVAAAAAGGG